MTESDLHKLEKRIASMEEKVLRSLAKRRVVDAALLKVIQIDSTPGNWRELEDALREALEL